MAKIQTLAFSREFRRTNDTAGHEIATGFVQVTRLSEESVAYHAAHHAARSASKEDAYKEQSGILQTVPKTRSPSHHCKKELRQEPGL
jgi:hypothetical protein